LDWCDAHLARKRAKLLDAAPAGQVGKGVSLAVPR
jgi:hypothetical protein